MKIALRTLSLAGSESLPPGCTETLLAGGGQLVDLRSPDAFRQARLPGGALNLPVEAFCYDFKLLDKREPVIVCGAHPAACVRVARLLAGQGFPHVYHLASSEG